MTINGKLIKTLKKGSNDRNLVKILTPETTYIHLGICYSTL